MANWWDAFPTAGSQPQAEDQWWNQYPTAEPTPAPEEQSSRPIQSLKRGYENLKATGYGLVALGADAVGAKETGDWALKGYKDTSELARSYASDVPSYTDIHSVSDAGKYAVDAVFENLPMFLPSLVTGGVGAAVARKGAESVVEKVVADKMAEGLTRAAAEKAAARTVLNRVAVGSAAGAAPSSIGMEAGSIYPDIVDETGQRGGAASAAAAVGGIAAGSLDVLPEVMVLKKAMGPVVDEFTGSLVKRVGKEAAKIFVTEAGTEGLQSIIEQASVMAIDHNKQIDWNDVVDSALKGGLGGAVLGAGGELVAHVRGHTSIETPETQERREPTITPVEEPAVQVSPEVAASLTPEDHASPIPTDLIAEGRQAMKDAIEGKPAETPPVTGAPETPPVAENFLARGARQEEAPQTTTPPVTTPPAETPPTTSTPQTLNSETLSASPAQAPPPRVETQQAPKLDTTGLVPLNPAAKTAEAPASPQAANPREGTVGTVSGPRLEVIRQDSPDMLDLSRKSTGWKRIDIQNMQGAPTGNVAIVNPATGETRTFTGNGAGAYAQAYAIDNPIKAAPVGNGPAPELVVKPLKVGGKEKPLPPGPPQAKPARGTTENADVLTFLAARGGIRDDEGHDLLKGRNLQKMTQRGNLIRKKGMSIDQAGEALWDAGYFGPVETTPRPTERQVLDLIESSHKTKTYLPHIQAQKDQAILAASQADQAKNIRAEVIAVAKERGASLSETEASAVMEIMADQKVDADAALDLYDERLAISAIDDAKESSDAEYADIPFDVSPAKPGSSAQEPGASVARPASSGASEGEGTPRAGANERPAQGDSRLTTDKTDQGTQHVLPGAERVSDRQMAERQMEGKAKPKAPQLNTEGLSLFDPDARPQPTLFDQPKAEKKAEPEDTGDAEKTRKALDWVRGKAKVSTTDTLEVTPESADEVGIPAGTYEVKVHSFKGTVPAGMMTSLRKPGKELANDKFNHETVRLGDGSTSGRNIVEYDRHEYRLIEKPEPAATKSEAVKPETSKKPGLDPDYRKQISKATGGKGVQVFAGETTGYDPITRVITVSGKPDADAVAALAKDAAPVGWKTAKVKVTVAESGKEVEVEAGPVAQSFADRVRRALSMIECVGK